MSEPVTTTPENPRAEEIPCPPVEQAITLENAFAHIQPESQNTKSERLSDSEPESGRGVPPITLDNALAESMPDDDDDEQQQIRYVQRMLGAVKGAGRKVGILEYRMGVMLLRWRSGPSGVFGKWYPFLATVGIEPRTAVNYMNLALATSEKEAENTPLIQLYEKCGVVKASNRFGGEYYDALLQCEKQLAELVKSLEKITNEWKCCADKVNRKLKIERVVLVGIERARDMFCFRLSQVGRMVTHHQKHVNEFIEMRYPDAKKFYEEEEKRLHAERDDHPCPAPFEKPQPKFKPPKKSIKGCNRGQGYGHWSDHV